MLQNATPLRKSAPRPPTVTSPMNMSLLLRVPREMHLCRSSSSLQILFKCPTPAIVCRNATKPSLTIPCACHGKRYLNVRKCSIPSFFTLLTSTCALRHNSVYTFCTSQLPKVVRAWCALRILTSKVATRHNGVHFLNISIPKSAPKLKCFYTFDFQTCIAPQRRALFRHLNCQKCSDAEMFCTFLLRNVLRATTACSFSSLIWPGGSAPTALASLLFDPPEP